MNNGNGNVKPVSLEKMGITARRFVNRHGEEMYHIEDIRGIATRDELPDEYLRDGDHVYLTIFPGGREGIFLSRGKGIVLGSNMTRADFERSLAFVMTAGERLHKINSAIVEKRKSWRGVKTFEM
jgi:hypothetical protein